MAESLITGVRQFLRAAMALYGAGDLAAGAPSPAPFGPIGLPQMSGATAAAHAEAVATNNARLDQLSDRDALVAGLTASAGDSIGFGRKVVTEGSEVFEKSVAALGPIARTPFGILALLAPAASVVGGVGAQLASSSGEMSDLAKQAPGQPDDDQRQRTRRVVRRTRGVPGSLVSSYQRSGSPLSPQERELFQRQLANYRNAGGSAPGMDLALLLAGARYRMGGFSERELDCSGAVSALVNYAMGRDPFESRMSTVNAPQWLAARGALPGLGGAGDISIGYYEHGGGGANGHMAATTGGINVESSSGSGFQVGGGARGADDPMFDQHWHIPGALLRGGTASIAV